jgi:hypothetical protein
MEKLPLHWISSGNPMVFPSAKAQLSPMVIRQGTSTPSYADVAMNIGDHLNLGENELTILWARASEITS